jgi:UDP:flavonoid glycosyltransferase YjiC (YdhE family)
MVLVGFGSTGIFGLSMQAEDFKNLAQAFTDLAPTRVLWALLPTNLPQGLTLDDLPLGPNVLVVPWVDYNDVLGHPATRLFISHCGIHSMWEAAFHGVPVIGVPFQKEQRDNALKLASRGLGEVNKESVAYRSAKNQLTFQRDTMRELARKVSGQTEGHKPAQ